MKKESGFKMKGFSGFGSPLRKDEKPRKGVLKGNMPNQTPNKPPKGPKAPYKPTAKKMKMAPLPSARFPDAYTGVAKYTDLGKETNYLNKANRYAAKYNPKTAGRGSLERNPYKGRKFSKAARSVGIKKYGSSKGLFSSFSKFFGKRATGILGLMGGTPLGASSTPKRSGSKPKPNFKAIGKDLKKAVYKGNKKRYK